MNPQKFWGGKPGITWAPVNQLAFNHIPSVVNWKGVQLPLPRGIGFNYITSLCYVSIGRISGVHCCETWGTVQRQNN